MKNIRHFILASLMGLIGMACKVQAPEEMRTLNGNQTLDIGAYELRTLVNEYANVFAAIVESAADSIIYSTDDKEVRVNALAWKLQAIPLIHKSVYFSDPLVAGADAIVLARQMTHYYEDGDGRDLFKAQQPIALRACYALEEQANVIAIKARSQENLVNVRSFADSFATVYPIKGQLYARKSIISDLSNHLAQQNYSIKTGLFTLYSGYHDFSSRLNTYAGQLPKIAAWEAEMIIEEKLGTDNVENALVQITSTAGALEELSQNLPQLLEGLRARSFEDVNAQSEVLLRALRAERELVFDYLKFERSLVLDALVQERTTILQEVRLLIQDGADGIGNRVAVETREVVDYIFWKLLLLVLVLGGLAIVAIVLYKKL